MSPVQYRAQADGMPDEKPVQLFVRQWQAI